MSKKLRKELIFLIVMLALYVAVFVCCKVFSFAWYIRLSAFAIVYIPVGAKVLLGALKKIIHGEFLDEDFLMAIASIGAFVIGEYSEAVAVMVFFRFGEWFERFAVGKSRKSISSLMEIKPQTATVIRNGEEVVVFPEEIQTGDTLCVKAGERIAVDGVIVEGETELDTRALTGESEPSFVKNGDSVLSGSIALSGKILIKASGTYENSTVAKILEMVENATDKKAKTEKFITAFARVYTPIVVALALLIGVIPSLFTGEWQVWIFKALTFLVVSCPCALVISVPLSFFGGIGSASGKGILIKGSNCIEALAKSKTFVLDKTGTITKGEFEVVKIEGNADENEILKLALVCENSSTHPVAIAVVNECKKRNVTADIDNYSLREIAGKGMVATKNNGIILCGNAYLMQDYGISVPIVENTTIYVSQNSTYVGCILVKDSIKESSYEAVKQLNTMGKTVMLTGDREAVANEVANNVGIQEVYHSLLPAQKAEIIENLVKDKKKGESVLFAGDGINDAPSLVSADVGVAMGNKGTSVAVESADVVLMYDDIRGIATAKKVAKKTMRIVKQNIVFALGVKIAVMLVTAVFPASMWLAVFADVGVSLIAILNAMRTLKIR
ncbi:MAG: cadmium-translocating P-type ATPase [Clostridiales bacterium]|nr:cadmium-translocating P-type ATPase [Clostridiales bacterium]